MGSIDRIPSNVELSHHINAKSKARHPSPLKDIIKFMGYDGMISFAGGSGAGNRQLVELAKELTETVHAPPCDYECLLHPGNTNAWAKVVGLLCEENDFVLVEEFTYPSAQALWIPLGIKAVPIPADADGILSQDLRSTLQNWDEEKRGGPRPRILYLVSVGSNPTGITISAQRRREIYDVCVEFVEDDPYYFLQFPGYLTPKGTAFQPKPTREFLKGLVPTFLSMDVQGRVIRLESFSKTLFPGLRTGYFVANPVFTERLLRATEVETQDPAGLSQALVLGLLRRWGIDGYLTWLQSLQFQYRERRDWLLDAFHARFAVLPAAKSPVPQAQGLVACVRSQQSGELRPVFSFVDPGAGMFVWCKFYFDGVDEFMDMEKSGGSKDPEQDFADELWKAWATELVLLTPGSYYHAWQGPDMTTTKARGADPRTAHFRFSFATPTKEQIDTGVERLSKVVERYWR
ncbi:Aromatic amino acid aminotransferase [Colletotrichum sp. SAR 10_98]|nr:Aromatic amino acid aminotransferase [Colletotrichum sp. SAR 10_98]